MNDNPRYTLSHAQRRIMYTESQYPDMSISNLVGTIEFEDEVQEDVLNAAVRHVIRQNDTLQIRLLPQREKEPLQYFVPPAEKVVEFLDFSDSPESLQIWVEEQTRKPFKLYNTPLFYFSYLKEGRDKGKLFVKVHHVMMDGISMNFIGLQITEYYRQLLDHSDPQDENRYSYKDYLREESLYETSPRFEKDKAFWNMQFDTLPEWVGLKPSHSYETSTRAIRTSILVDHSLQETIHGFCKNHSVNPFSLFLTALFLTLHKMTAHEDIVLGNAYANRTRKAEKEMLGMTVSTSPIRMNIDPRLSVLEFLSQVVKQQAATLRHQKYPYNLIINNLRERHFDFDNLFGIAIEYRPIDWGAIKSEWLFNGEEINELSFHIEHNLNAGTFAIHLDYLQELFSEEEVRKILNYLLTLLKGLLAHPNNRIDELEILPSEDKARILTRFNQLQPSFVPAKPIHKLFEAHAHMTPRKIAVVFKDRKLTYGEINRRANRLAWRLRSMNVQANDLVAILAERSIDMVVGVLGVWKAGAAYVPIDPDYPADRIRYLLDDSGSKLVIGHRKPMEKVSFSGDALYFDDETLSSENTANPQSDTKPHDLAYVMYTSGTTGNPKGVMIEQRNLQSMVQAWEKAYQLDIAPVNLLQMASFSFDVFFGDLARSLLHGGKMVICQSEDRLDPPSIYKLIRKYNITMLDLTPAIALPLMNYIEENRLDIRKMQWLILGSDRCSATDFRNLQLKFGSRMRIRNCYGVTEASVDASYYEANNDTLSLAGNAPIGRPFLNVQMFVMDKSGHLQPIGVPGELVIGGAGVGRGYLNRPELTAEKFVPNPFAPGERMYRTGDLARWLPDGNIEFLDRIDHQVKIRGYRIELGEIEAQLLRAGLAQEAIVVARENAQGYNELCAYVVAEQKLTVQQLRGALADLLPSYMIPSRFMQLDKFPLTPNGKIDRKALPEHDGKVTTNMAYVAPRTQTERQLATIWEEILHVSQAGVHDNFFDLGGHSLRAMTLVSRIHKQFEVEANLRDVFQYPTLESLAAMIARQATSTFTAIHPAAERPYYPLSSAQKRMYVLSQMEGAGTSYNMPVLLRLEGKLDRMRLSLAIIRMIAQHESLRTSFELTEGEVVQVVHPFVPFAINEKKAAETEVDALVKAFIRPFDLSQAPLLRVELIELAEEYHVLLLDMPHIISDGVSLGFLVEDFTKLYAGESLSPLRIQYKDYTVWVQERQGSETMAKHEAYWLNTFAGELPVLQLPTDYPRPSVRRFDGDRITFTLDATKTQGIKSLAEETGTTLYMVLLAAYIVMLLQYTGQDEIIVGTPTAGRTHADLDRIMGMFVNTLAIRSYPTREKTFAGFLDEVKKHTLEAFGYQAFPFEALVERLNLRRDPSRNPLFDTMFALQNAEMQSLDLPGLRVAPFENPNRVAKFDLTLEVSESETECLCHLEYNTDLFASDTIEKMANDYRYVIESILRNRQMAIKDFPLKLHKNEQAIQEEISFRF
ncbi:non-ribosomal peptide synthetase [Cohnella lupini]|uniref:Amino acid adenylation domain-containing protein n=1 Tax=Cohnella lupini TaxID=1294267 RepID=A0A3D9I4Z7_9BACL|nr:non-ribosomal peptide synthetase [Cohnella lupini]RED56619.1 amino acid adenylation domain-containing protein [Cohnella lupini]